MVIHRNGGYIKIELDITEVRQLHEGIELDPEASPESVGVTLELLGYLRNIAEA